MAEIMTVRGPIAPEDLGFTSMHEHVLLDGRVFRKAFEKQIPKDIPLPIDPDDPVRLDNIGHLRRNFFLCWDAVSIEDEALMTAEMADFKASGGSALVDMSTPGLRCNLPAIQRMSKETGVHVVTTTGLYLEDSWPEEFKDMTVNALMDYMRKEIEEGIDDTDIKPGHLKIAVSNLTGRQERIIRAAVRMSNETGLSLTVHPGFFTGSDGRRIVKILFEEGMDLERVIFAHSQWFFANTNLKTLVMNPETWGLNLDYCLELLDQGANLSIDTFGHHYDVELAGYVRVNEWQRLGGLMALIQRGYSKQLVLGTDTYLKVLTRWYGGEGYSRLTKFVIPFLTKYLDAHDRVSDFDIRQMTIDNPIRLLTR